MSWNYRLVKWEESGDTFFGVSEVYYNKAGEVQGYTYPEHISESPEDIKRELETILKDIERHPEMDVAMLGEETILKYIERHPEMEVTLGEDV